MNVSISNGFGRNWKAKNVWVRVGWLRLSVQTGSFDIRIKTPNQ